MNAFGRKFSQEYKNQVKKIYQLEGLQKALEFVKKDYPKTANRTIKSWVDESYGERVKNTRKKSYEKSKVKDPEKVKRQQKASYLNDKERRKTDARLRKRRVGFSKSWAGRNRPRIRELDKKYWKNETTRQKAYERKKKRKENDLGFHLLENARSRAYGLLKTALNGSVLKHCSTSKFFGCSPKFLSEHLRRQYKPGMTDENYGKEWHLDHIKPCSLFDLTDKKQFLECWHYTNLQPLWAHENLAKSDKYELSEAETNNPF